MARQHPIPKRIEVIVDTREQHPLMFPGVTTYYSQRTNVSRHDIHVKTTKRKLDTGDYAIKGYEDVVLVERKGSLRELQGNFFSGEYQRVMKALKRLANEAKYSYLLLDFPKKELNQRGNHVAEPWLVLDTLLRTCAHLGIMPIFFSGSTAVSQRRTSGEFMLHIMLAHIFPGSQPNGGRIEKGSAIEKATGGCICRVRGDVDEDCPCTTHITVGEGRYARRNLV